MKKADLYARASEAALALRRRGGGAPSLGLVLGSGLGAFVDAIEGARSVSYEEVPQFPSPSVEGHAGRAVFGEVAGVEVVALAGRAHFYEGHPMETVTLPVRALALLGARALVLTNAAGAIRSDLRPGDLMAIEDHLNLLGENPLRGPHDPRLGGRFPDLTRVYDREVIGALSRAGARAGVTMRRGVYAAVSGPSYETPAEVRMLRRLGADAVGMSTVPEAVVAHQMGLRVGAVSAITNPAAGISQRPLRHEEVLEVGAQIAGSFSRFLREAVGEIASLLRAGR